MGEGCGAKCYKNTAGDGLHAQRNADVVKVSVGIHPLPHGPIDGADATAIDLVEDRNVAVKCSGLGFGVWGLVFGVEGVGLQPAKVGVASKQLHRQYPKYSEHANSNADRVHHGTCSRQQGGDDDAHALGT